MTAYNIQLSTFGHKFRDFLSEQSRPNMIGICLILSMAVIAPFFGGWDYLVAFRGETLSGHYVYTYNPLPVTGSFIRSQYCRR